MLDINLEFVRGILFVRLSGTLDGSTYTKLSDCLDNMIHEKGLRYFIINLEDLDYIGEEGIQAIIDRYFDVALHDGKLVICGYKQQMPYRVEILDTFECIERGSNELSACRLINI